MKIAYAYADSNLEWNCSEWRALCPSDAINYAAEHDPAYAGWSAKLIHISGFLDYLSPAIQDIIGPADLVVVQRNVIRENVIDVIRYWQGLGKAIAIDLDDDYPGLPWSNPAYPFWIQNSEKLDPPPLMMLERGMRITNALISPNRNILQDWAYAAKGYYLPNFARTAWWTNLPSRTEQKAKLGLADKIIIGWGGSVSHYDSWWGSGLREAALDIVRQFPQVVFMICGNDTRIYEQLDVPLANKRYQPGVSPNDWPKIVQSFDIGVAPLSGTFDQRRSWIKTLEYGLAGVPWLASTGEPYSDHAALGKLIEPGAENWTRALRSLIRNLGEEQVIADTRINFYRQWLIDNQLPTLEKTYKAIIANFSADHGMLPNVHWVNWDGAKSVNETTAPLVPNELFSESATIPQPTSEELALVNLAHLRFIEDNTANITIDGVDILRAGAYDLIQLLNHNHLAAIMPKVEVVA